MEAHSQEPGQVDKSDTPDLSSLLANYEYRLIWLEYEVGLLQGRPPKNIIRRIVWFLSEGFMHVAPIVGGAALLLADEQLKVVVGAMLLGYGIAKSGVDFWSKVLRGPREYKSLIVKDHR